MHFEIRQNIPAYLADLNHWLAETRDDPLEEMSNFFTERVSTYEEHMARWNEAYRSMAERIPDNCGSLLDKTTPRLIQFHTLKNAANPPFLGGFSIFGTVAAEAEQRSCQGDSLFSMILCNDRKAIVTE